MTKVKVKSELLEWGQAILIAAILLVGIRFLFVPVVVEGSSMMPTLEDGDRLIVNKAGPKIADYKRFDVIVFEANDNTNYIKRIIGLPGDHIQYENDTLFINGKAYEEAYLESYKNTVFSGRTLTQDFKMEAYLDEEIVPEGHYFVLGDNRQRSKDSRDPRIGFVPEEEILGIAEVVIFPINHLKTIK